MLVAWETFAKKRYRLFVSFKYFEVIHIKNILKNKNNNTQINIKKEYVSVFLE